MRDGILNLSYGKPMSIRDDKHAKDVLLSVVTRVNEIACRQYDIPLIPLRLPQRGEASQDKQTGGQYDLKTKDIYLNLDYILKEPDAGNPESAAPLGLIETLVHEITHGYQDALARGTTKHYVPPGFRDAGMIFDFNAANYAPVELVYPLPYRLQPMERHAHYVGYTVQRNLEYGLRARGARWGIGKDKLSEERIRTINAWSESSTKPNPSERDAMGLGALFPRHPDTIPPWQRSAGDTDKPRK
jgi:hypothetical protein